MPQSDATFSMSSTLPRREPRLRGSPPVSGRAEKAYTERGAAARAAAAAAASGAAHMTDFPSTMRSFREGQQGLRSHVAQGHSRPLLLPPRPASSGLRPPSSRVGGCGLAGCGHRPCRAEPQARQVPSRQRSAGGVPASYPPKTRAQEGSDSFSKVFS